MECIERLNLFYQEKLSIPEVTECLESYNKVIDGFIIYGCGLLGNYLKDILKQLSLNLIGYVDDFYSGDKWDGVDVYSLEEAASFEKRAFCPGRH